MIDVSMMTMNCAAARTARAHQRRGLMADIAPAPSRDTYPVGVSAIGRNAIPQRGILKEGEKDETPYGPHPAPARQIPANTRDPRRTDGRVPGGFT
jgi:hypothetical protein